MWGKTYKVPIWAKMTFSQQH